MTFFEFADRHIFATLLLAYLVCQSAVWIVIALTHYHEEKNDRKPTDPAAP